MGLKIDNQIVVSDTNMTLKSMVDRINGSINKSSLPKVYTWSTTNGGDLGIQDLQDYLEGYAPQGITNWYVSLNGAIVGVICMKSSSSYLSFLMFSYTYTLVQYKMVNGTWSKVSL